MKEYTVVLYVNLGDRAITSKNVVLANSQNEALKKSYRANPEFQWTDFTICSEEEDVGRIYVVNPDDVKESKNE